MTQAPHRSPLAVGSLDEVAAAIRRRGGRLSAARRRVLEALFAADGPVSAEYIVEGMDGQSERLERTSVYRNLLQLEELGVVHHVHVGHGPGLYVLETAPEREYLVCERCDRVETVEAARLEPARDAIRAEVGYEARFSHFPIVGLCPACAAAEEERPASRPHAHSHSHGALAHDHPHSAHDHAHTDHEHQHSHGDYAHSHPHTHEQGLEHLHGHSH